MKEKKTVQRLFSYGNRLVLYLFQGFLLMTLYFAMTSTNLVIGDNSFFGTSTTGVTAGFVLISLALIISFAAYPSVRRLGAFIFQKHRYITAITFLIVVVILQVAFVYYVHPEIGWDVSAIHNGVIDPSDSELQAYFSLNYNNIPILLLQRQLATLFSNTSWHFFDMVTLVLVDLSALLNIASIAVLDKKKVPVSIYLHGIWLLLFPSIIVPYTDTWVLPFVSLYLLSYCLMFHSRLKIGYRWFAAVLFGISTTGAYFMKPSALIGVIAIVLIELLFALKKKTNQKPAKKSGLLLLSCLAVSVFSAGISYVLISQQLDKQTHIKVNKEREIPAVHFISMGMSGDGGYNPEDALAMAALPSEEAKVQYSVDKIKERLKEKGIGGYLAFLVKKQSNNTADGTFGWLKEGNFIAENQSPKKRSTSEKIKNFFYLYGENIADFRFISQLWWIIWLIIIAFGWRNQHKFTQMLRLAILGGFLFLLIFEGGRSRYLIQFLPYFLLLAALVCNDAFYKIKKLISGSF